jgi:hypothetical protein
METELVTSLSAAATAAAMVGLASSLLTIKLKMDAERRLLELLSAEDRAQHLRKLRSQVMQDGVTTPEELQQLVDSLEPLLQELSAEHRRAIGEGLHQRSMRGRARYIAKLMNKAGIGSGPLLVAVE